MEAGKAWLGAFTGAKPVYQLAECWLRLVTGKSVAESLATPKKPAGKIHLRRSAA